MPARFNRRKIFYSVTIVFTAVILYFLSLPAALYLNHLGWINVYSKSSEPVWTPQSPHHINYSPFEKIREPYATLFHPLICFSENSGEAGTAYRRLVWYTWSPEFHEVFQWINTQSKMKAPNLDPSLIFTPKPASTPLDPEPPS